MTSLLARIHSWFAPVKLGAKSFIAAGTTVSEDVPAGALALTRPEQITVKGWGRKKFERFLSVAKPKPLQPKRRKLRKNNDIS